MKLIYENNRGNEVSVEVLRRFPSGGVKVKTKAGKICHWSMPKKGGRITSINIGKETFVGYGWVED